MDYANVVNTFNDALFPSNTLSWIIVKVFISWLNLDFGISTCFYEGLDAYSYTWLQFVFPFYLWFLVGLYKAVQSQELQNKDEIQTTFVDMREPLLEEPLT